MFQQFHVDVARNSWHIRTCIIEPGACTPTWTLYFHDHPVAQTIALRYRAALIADTLLSRNFEMYVATAWKRVYNYCQTGGRVGMRIPCVYDNSVR
jgi:hypothetical protein